MFTTQTNKLAVVLTGLPQAVSVTFPFFESSSVIVVKTDQTTLLDTVLTETTHYTVSGGAGSTGSVSVTAGASVGDTITVYRLIPSEQTLSLPTGEAMPSQDVEERFDRITMMIIGIKSDISRCLRLAETSPDISAGDVKDPTSKVLAFDDTDALVGYTYAQLAALLALTITEDVYATHTFADDAARAADVPDFVGQIGFQRDTKVGYIATGLVAGNWETIAALIPANNLSDVDDAATARDNLGANDANNITEGTLSADRLPLDQIVLNSQFFS